MLSSDLSAHPWHHAIVLDIHPPIGWHINARGPNNGGSGGIGNDIHSAMRVDRADHACISVLPLWGRRGPVVAARVHIHISVFL